MSEEGKPGANANFKEVRLSEPPTPDNRNPLEIYWAKCRQGHLDNGVQPFPCSEYLKGEGEQGEKEKEAGANQYICRYVFPLKKEMHGITHTYGFVGPIKKTKDRFPESIGEENGCPSKDPEDGDITERITDFDEQGRTRLTFSSGTAS